MGEETTEGRWRVSVERDVPCLLRDGVTLFADVYRPAGDPPWPVLLMRTPYDKTQAESNVGYTHPSWYACRGYLVVVQDCRGRCRSEGSFTPFEHEAADGFDAVEWAARLPGSSGAVAMYGFSYPGIVQLLAARERPPSLVAIAPAFTGAQAYDGWTYDGGAFALAFATTWVAQLAVDEARRRGDEARMSALLDLLRDPDRLYWKLPLEELRPLLEDGAAYFFEWLEHDAHDDYWRRWSIDEAYGRIEVAALHVAGWYDTFARGTVRNFAGLRRDGATDEARVRQKLVIGPWYHMPWAPLGGAGRDAGASVIDDWHLRWFDHVLKGRANGALEAPVTAYVLNDGWCDFDAWPPTGTSMSRLYLHSQGRANSATGDGALSMDQPLDEPSDVFVYDPLTPTLSAGGHSCCWPGGTPMGPACQAGLEQWNGVLSYTTDVFERDAVIVGDVRLVLYASSTAEDTDFTARLCIVDADGRSTNLLEGIRRGRFRNSLETAEPIRPGQVHEYRLELGPIGVRVRAGQRLRLNVSSSDFPQWDRNLNDGGRPGRSGPASAVIATQTVLHDRARPSHVLLPVMPAGDGIRRG